MQIRHTKPEDIPAVLALYEGARRFMVQNGNPNQWTDGYPGRDQLEADLAADGSYVCTDGDKIVGTFFFIVGEEPAYRRIEDGRWLNDRPYGVVHRITAASGTRGIASFCLDWCFSRWDNIRIDTHQDNIPMQRALAKNGYQRCGTIYLADGSARIAFQKER